jgi:hypothetical protein
MGVSTPIEGRLNKLKIVTAVMLRKRVDMMQSPEFLLLISISAKLRQCLMIFYNSGLILVKKALFLGVLGK